MQCARLCSEEDDEREPAVGQPRQLDRRDRPGRTARTTRAPATRVTVTPTGGGGSGVERLPAAVASNNVSTRNGNRFETELRTVLITGVTKPLG